MSTLGELYSKYRNDKNLFSNFSVKLLERLENIFNGNEIVSYNKDFEIDYLGPMGICIVNSEGGFGGTTCFDLNEIWNLQIEKENWQKEALPAVFEKNGVDEKVILQLILKDFDYCPNDFITLPSEENNELVAEIENLTKEIRDLNFEKKIIKEKEEVKKEENREENYVFSVNGSIEDGMQGIPFTLGVYDSFNLAEQELLNFIKNWEYVKENNSYDVFHTSRFHFVIFIEKQVLNKTIIPSCFN